MSGQPWLGDERPTWIAEVEAWVTAMVADAGQGKVVELQAVKERVWGAVLRVVTDQGALYFKACGPVCRHEPLVIEAIAPRWPRLAPEMLAVDHERAWMLLSDHGQPMVALPARTQVDVLMRLAPDYAEMQRSTTDLLPAWIAAGMPDRQVERLPSLLAALLDGTSPIGRLRIPDADRAALDDTEGAFAEVCRDLSGTPHPVGIDHADIHGTNAFVDGSRARLADWGDACATHPFSSMAVPYAFVVARLPATERHAATLRLREAYLAPWG